MPWLLNKTDRDLLSAGYALKIYITYWFSGMLKTRFYVHCNLAWIIWSLPLVALYQKHECIRIFCYSSSIERSKRAQNANEMHAEKPEYSA